MEAELTTPSSLDDLARALRQLGHSGTPRVAALARWASDQPEEIALNSVRSLAERSGANANTVVRLSQALGFAGYEACRNAFQDALRHGGDREGELYGRRAGELTGKDSASVLDAIREAGHRNLESAFTTESRAAIDRAAQLMIEARQVYVVGVRSCYAIADYLGYTARMAFDNFAPRAGTPGDIRDRIALAGPEDVVLSISFRHYSVETIAAHELALRQGARTIAITDDPKGPLARGADVVMLPEMHGPQPLPSMIGTFALVEALVASMVVQSGEALANITRFEQRLQEAGAYR
ncbi:MurR/RpiR family transcriptional regulator [Alloyangia pacifica]|uniref:MurR/RpiR family transcriptional regulator n=1 Tax=Alloyangia pacifica TaxID=311180 RepID=UPI001CFE030A|nr:MurR/RpiR family transcriptional regulator [Alloyangia pacifica]